MQVSAFLFANNPFASNATASTRTSSKEIISNRLAELRRLDGNRSKNSSNSGREQEGSGLDLDGVDPSTAAKMLGQWPVTFTVSTEKAEGGQDESNEGGRTTKSLVIDPKPEIKLLHRFKKAPGPEDNAFWQDFMQKCRLAWGVFFPPPARPRRHTGWGGLPRSLGRLLGQPGGGTGGAPAAEDGTNSGQLVNGLSAKQVVLNRLQMILIADRCGVAPEALLEMKAQALVALADYLGNAGAGVEAGQLELQVSALKPNGDRVTMNISFADMLADEQLRDPLHYHYECEDPDDYFYPEEDDGHVAAVAEAPAAGMMAAAVRADAVDGATGAAGQGAGGAQG